MSTPFITASERTTTPIKTLHQWPEAAKRGFAIWTPPVVAVVTGDAADRAALAPGELVRDKSSPTAEPVEEKTSTILSETAAGGENSQDSNGTMEPPSTIVAAVGSYDFISLRNPVDQGESRASLTSLPTELLSQILDLALLNIRQYQKHRHLERYSLINRRFAPLAQSRLFENLTFHGRELSRRLSEAAVRTWTYTRSLQIIEATILHSIELAILLAQCPRLEELRLSGTRIDLGSVKLSKFLLLHSWAGRSCSRQCQVLDRSFPTDHLKTLNLEMSTVVTSSELPFASRSSCGSLVHLRSVDAQCCSPHALPLFPSLESLYFDHALDAVDPLHLQHLIARAPNVRQVEVKNLYPANQLCKYLCPPSPEVKDSLAATACPTSSGLVALADPSLRELAKLEHLILWSDSSHRSSKFFPLLDTLSPQRNTLRQLTVRADWGYRDRAQEVEGMEKELLDRLDNELKNLKLLVLPKEFKNHMNRLQEKLKGRILLHV